MAVSGNVSVSLVTVSAVVISVMAFAVDRYNMVPVVQYQLDTHVATAEGAFERGALSTEALRYELRIDRLEQRREKGEELSEREKLQLDRAYERLEQIEEKLAAP